MVSANVIWEQPAAATVALAMQCGLKSSVLIIRVLLLLLLRLKDVQSKQIPNNKEPVLYLVTPPVSHGEGPFWDTINQELYFVDISAFAVHRISLENNTHSSLTLNDTVSFIIPIEGETNKFVIGLGLAVQILTWNADNSYILEKIASVDEERPENRFNDAKADLSGVLWAGTMGHEHENGYIKPNQGSLYSWSPENCDMKKRLDSISISNGLVWPHNGNLLYFIDTSTRRIDAFDYNGTISNRRVAFDFAKHKVPGSPDGMTIDENGFLWIACWGGSRIIQVDPIQDKLLRVLKLPIERVTSVTFGGPQMNILFVTTMRHGLNDSQIQEQPAAGSTFAITNLQVKGTQSYRAAVNCNII